jgi:hypothetical protein
MGELRAGSPDPSLYAQPTASVASLDALGPLPSSAPAQPSVRTVQARVEHAELPEAQPAALGKAQNASLCLPPHGRASQAPGLGPTR